MISTKRAPRPLDHNEGSQGSFAPCAPFVVSFIVLPPPRAALPDSTSLLSYAANSPCGSEFARASMDQVCSGGQGKRSVPSSTSRQTNAPFGLWTSAGHASGMRAPRSLVQCALCPSSGASSGLLSGNYHLEPCTRSGSLTASISSSLPFSGGKMRQARYSVSSALNCS